MLTFKPFTTSKIWQFRDPDTNRLLTADNRKQLTTLIYTYRSQNNLAPIYRLNDVIDNYLCKQPANLGNCMENKKLPRSAMQYLKGGIDLLVNMLYSSYVPQGEADRRAQVCLGCTHNTFPDKTGFIKWSDTIAVKSVGSRKSAHHDKLGNCGVCSCVLRAKVWKGGTVSLSPNELKTIKETKPDCWQLEFLDGKK